MFYLEIEYTKDKTYFGFPDLYLYEINFATKNLTFGIDFDDFSRELSVIEVNEYDSEEIFKPSVSYRSKYWTIKI